TGDTAHPGRDGLYPLPQPLMRERIQKVLLSISRLAYRASERLSATREEGRRPGAAGTGYRAARPEGVRVRINQVGGEGGRQYRVWIEECGGASDEWAPFACVEEGEVYDVLSLLYEAIRYMERVPPYLAAPYWLTRGME